MADYSRALCISVPHSSHGAAKLLTGPISLAIGRSEWYQPIGDWIARIGAEM